MPEFHVAAPGASSTPAGSHDDVRTFRPVPLGSTPARAEAYDDARAEGFAAGYAAGVQRANREARVASEAVAAEAARAAVLASARVDEALRGLSRAALVVREIAAPVLTDTTAAVHAAALELAEVVLGVELADDERSARAALARVRAAELGPGPVTVRLHPRDVAAVLASGTADAVDVVLEADPSLEPGDAVAEHADGHLDARIGAALRRARAALLEVAS
ncbi:FliH/SctL family protein [Cellulomonas edaphi]|uniref:FliH/SctL family protein n=1 Tax=Cellulomonas edaphi TaxID=3053468 RepID=A0ABT7S4I7_9CELL|nr:FliH/SctL family protein [Cellulomons edaphi]MDM7830545.1 FliH/SctL family protein [Cellulomons edaphi]